jgi:two-component system chemotaxis response regulator CheY
MGLKMARVLLVDDDPLVRRSLAIAIENAGHVVTEAGTGTQALRAVHASPVDIVVTDIFMPDGEGIEFIMEMRKEGSTLPIIAMTGGYIGPLMSGGSDPTVYLKAAGMLGASLTLAKPFKPAELCAAIDACLSAQAPPLKRAGA